MTILKEGGNVFKTEPKKELIAQRIATPDVDPTIKWLEKVIGWTIDEEDLLGTTGKKNPITYMPSLRSAFAMSWDNLASYNITGTIAESAPVSLNPAFSIPFLK